MNRSIQKEYSFGDSTLAEKRLELLADVFEPSSRVFLVRLMGALERRPELAIDLGSGPGRTTTLLYDVLAPARALGFDESPIYVESSRRKFASPFVDFDVRRLGGTELFDVEADVVYGRHLLAHVSEKREFVASLVPLVRAGGLIAFEENFDLSSEDPLFASYYDFVKELLVRRGQRMDIGREMEAHFAEHFVVLDFRVTELFLDPKKMALLHLLNIAAFRETDFGRESLELLSFLERGFTALTTSHREAPPVRCQLAQIVARKRAS